MAKGLRQVLQAVRVLFRAVPVASLALLALLGLGHTALHAQSSNILGLPAVPQTPAASASGPAAARPTPTPTPSAAPSAPTDADIKSALSGSIGLASFYQDGLITVRVTTAKTFVGSVPRTQALQAARLVQRDVRLACAKLCKPGPMPAPTLQADNTLRFDVVIADYVGTLSTADMVNLVSAKAIGPGGKVVPVPVPVPTNPSVAPAVPPQATPSVIVPSAAAPS